MSVQSDGSESRISSKVVGERHDVRHLIYMAHAPPYDPEDPLAPARGLGVDGLLALLERLGAREEAAVVRGALAAGVPPVVARGAPARGRAPAAPQRPVLR